jgi:hypothetical protein
MQVELLDRQRWRTRMKLANAMFDCLEVPHNRRRRHSALGWLTPSRSLDRRRLPPLRDYTYLKVTLPVAPPEGSSSTVQVPVTVGVKSQEVGAVDIAQ